MDLLTVFRVTVTSLLVACVACDSTATKYDPCCSFPCESNGICYTAGFDNYICDCTRTGYYGKHCETAQFSTKIRKFLKPSPDTIQHLLTNYRFVWGIINSIDWLRKAMMGLVLKARVSLVQEPSPYIGDDEYTSWRTYTNKTVYARTLPPVPSNCPTPMGVKGPKQLPEPEEVARVFLLRRKFSPCPRRTNVIFPFFGQHFNHQYFKTNLTKGLPFQWGSQLVDLSHVYGDDIARENALRSHVDGKMKVSIFNGEAFPPRAEEVKVAPMPWEQMLKKEHRLVFGHKGFALMPSFLLFSTLWLREHNRVCDILREEHPEWNDERLYQTARLVVTGETIKVIIEDYVQHLSGFHFKLLYDPDVLMDGLSHHNQIHLEFHNLYHWHPLIPDTIALQGRTMMLQDLVLNPGPFLQAGIGTILKDLQTQFAGRVAGGRNQGVGTIAVAIKAINDGRKMRLQPFNNYRKKFNLTPFKSFEELTGEKEMAAELREHYGDIDALELYVGLIVEKRREKQLFGETLTEMGSPYSLKGLYGSPLGSPGWWKPVTFGGDVGFNIVKTASLQTLICNNVEGCPNISFSVPDNITYSSGEEDQGVVNDNTADTLISLSRNPAEVVKVNTIPHGDTCDKLDGSNCGAAKEAPPPIRET